MHTDWNDLKARIGFDRETCQSVYDEKRLIEYINIKLRSRGWPIFGKKEDYPLLEMSDSLLQNVREKNRLLKDHLCPVDQSVQSYLEKLFEPHDIPQRTWVPNNALVLERYGMARALSLPPNSDKFESDIISSFRVKQGIINNPAKDRRTTKGVFHVVDEGLPVPADKKMVPVPTFAKLLEAALNPPDSVLELPFTACQENKARLFVSLLLRPIVCPMVPGVTKEKRTEVRFFAPGNLVSNLDFVESIFGNAGDPYLVENDARLDISHWSGHTGCVVLAPHLINLKKKDVGLPHVSDATERQKRDGMCWEDEDELYNDGTAFKVTSRDQQGVVVTLIADNYYGYCKKEVKTQISYAANLLGNVEEEHAGGALTFASYDLGEDFRLSEYIKEVDHTYEEMLELHGDSVEEKEEGYAIDKKYPNIYYVPQDAHISLHETSVTWEKGGAVQKLQLRPNVTYVLPSGYKVEMFRPMEGRRWRLVGTGATGTFCHKPCTVSGGGKSEISKPLADAIVVGPIFTADFKKDFDLVEEIINRNYGQRFKDQSLWKKDGRPLLHEDRSLGSVIKLLSPSDEYSEDYNHWLESIPGYIIDLALVVKRFYKPDWGSGWRERFSVDIVNGRPGNELKYRDQMLTSTYLRVGFAEDGSWRIFSLRKDFHPAVKIQTEDDISSSVIVAASLVKGLDQSSDAHPSLKFIKNCEYRLFQRPDEAIHRGYDKTTEKDFSKTGLFFSNYQPLEREETKEMERDAIRFNNFTPLMRDTLVAFNRESTPEYVVSSSNPRLVDGKPSANPRYLQTRLDLEDERTTYLSEVGAKLYRRLPDTAQAPFPVSAVLPGRRNNPPQEKIRSLAVYNPIHFQELPELFMDFIASLTGKSPSTTGAGSEGALTKGPFNMLPPIIDLNNALVSYLVTGYEAYTSSAGCVGPKCRVDHDISLLIPEIWCRMSPFERRSEHLIENGFLEPCLDFNHEGKLVQASRLGYRITREFVQAFGGRIFGNPQSVFPDFMLRPELQDLDTFVDGVANIVETQQRVALNYFEDGSVDMACPPLRALLHIMAHGEYEGKDYKDPEIRALFTRASLEESDWYRERLDQKVANDIALWDKHKAYLEKYMADPRNSDLKGRLNVEALHEELDSKLEFVKSQAFRDRMNGSLGVDPSLFRKLDKPELAMASR